MKAVRIHRYGGPEVLSYEEVPKPEAGPGELLVRVHAAGINPIDWKIRAGHHKLVMRFHLPTVLGWDLSGVVEAVGAGVGRFRPGDEVFARPDIKQKMEALGLEILPAQRRTPEHLAKFLKEDIERWSVVIKAAGIHVD